MNVGECRFFPDANVVIGLILREHRNGPQNSYYLKAVQENKLVNTILPSVEEEFHERLDEVADEAGKILDAIHQELWKEKSLGASKARTIQIGLKDVPLMEQALSQVFGSMSRQSVDGRGSSRFHTVFDLVTSWIMMHWTKVMTKGTSVDLDELVDELKLAISNGRQELEDSLLLLKAQLRHVPSDWAVDQKIAARVQPWVPDSDDVTHIASVATFVSIKSARGLFVTNDNEVLRNAPDIKRESGATVTRPAFALAVFLADL